MEILVLSRDDVARLLPLPECMTVMAQALEDLARGQASMPLRTILPVPGSEGVLGFMPGMLQASGVFGAKITAVFESNLGTEFESHQGFVVLFESEHGRPLAVVDAGEVTAIRTAAVSGVATRALAREDARVLALIGSGGQAHSHLEAMLVARPIEEVRVWSRTAEHARAFVVREVERSERERPELRFSVAGDAEQAVSGADVICTLTAASEPVVHGEWLSPGVHVNAVGWSGAAGRELDAEALRRSTFFVDRRESILNEGGEFLLARAEGVFGDDHIRGELGEVLLGSVPGRTSPAEITMFRSLGLAVEDVASAHYLYQVAKKVEAGVWAPLAGTRSGA